jgi:hypothetical protein
MQHVWGEGSYIQNFRGEARGKEKFMWRKAKYKRHDYKTNEDTLSDIKISPVVKKNSKLHK